ncbi:MAG: hypothetical protein HKO66_11190 [Saprospiraceae bacterium]|nr:hypothetical protein [Bacteroidia bacterium]NNL92790.1 hypothetical protein [Saprospiraceae bacterium]
MKKLRYRDKLKYAEEAMGLIDNGESLKEFKTKMKNLGYINSQIDKILKSAKTQIYDKYGPKVNQYLLATSLDQHLDEFENLSDEDFEAIQKREYERIISKSKATVSRLTKEGKSKEYVINEVVNPYFNENDVDNHLETYHYYNSPVSGEEKNNYQVIGVGLILAGLGLFYLSYDMDVRKFRALIIVIIIFGIRNLIKSRSTKAAIKRMNDNKKRFWKENNQG